MDELNLSQFISDLEINLGYSMEPNTFTLTPAVASESNRMQVDQNTITIIEPNLQPSLQMSSTTCQMCCLKRQQQQLRLIKKIFHKQLGKLLEAEEAQNHCHVTQSLVR